MATITITGTGNSKWCYVEIVQQSQTKTYWQAITIQNVPSTAIIHLVADRATVNGELLPPYIVDLTVGDNDWQIQLLDSEIDAIYTSSGGNTPSGNSPNQKTRINGTNYSVAGGKIRIGGTNYSISGGRARIGGTNYNISFKREATISITGSGDEQNCYVMIGNTKYYTRRTVSVLRGDTITLFLLGQAQNASIVIDGETVAQGFMPMSYEYIINSNCTINLFWDYPPKITVTTT